MRILKYFLMLFILLAFSCQGLQPDRGSVNSYSADKSDSPEMVVMQSSQPPPDDLQKMTEQGETTKARAYTDFEGTSDGHLGKTLCTSLATGDQAWVQTGSVVAFYTYNSSNTTAEDTTNKTYIHCNPSPSSWTTGNWILSPIKTTVINPSGTPTITGYDDDVSKDTWEITGNSDGTDGTMDFKVQTAADTLTKFFGLDGANSEIDVLKPINSNSLISGTGIDAGTRYVVNPGNIDLDDSPYTGVCRMYITIASDTEIQLPNDAVCSTGYAKEFCFKSRVASADFTLSPDSNDEMQFGDNGAGGAGKNLRSHSVSPGNDTTRGDFICIFGRVSGGTEYWTDLAIQCDNCSYEP